jgi:4-hydroxy-tetrahydrodipicolinate synthase
MNRLSGIVPPLVTPLDSTGGLDHAALARLIDRVIAGGVAGIFVLGTTGEGPSLSSALRRDVVSTACELAAGRVPVLVGISDTSLDDSLRLAEHARASGATAVVATAPYYFPLSQQDLARYFLALAEATPLPVYLYNMPACVRVEISYEVLQRCASSPNIAGVKDSSGDINYFFRILQMRTARPDWSFFVGPELLLAEATRAGGDGGVNGGAMLAPELFVAQFAAAQNGDIDTFSRLQKQIERVGEIYRVGNDFVGVARGLKCALSLLGICDPRMALPFIGADDEDRIEIELVLASLRKEGVLDG